MDYMIKEETLTDIADAIRSQTGDVNPISVSDFATQITNISGAGTITVKKYTASLTSSQYGWFTFVDENGSIITNDSTKIPVLATAPDGAKYYSGSFFVYESTNRYLFKIYDINDSSAHGYEGSSKTLTFDLAYVESSQNGGSDSHSYSTTEQAVGTWIDGSPVYEKVVDLGALPNNTTKNVAHGISNLGRVIQAELTADNGSNWVTIPYATTNSTDLRYQLGFWITDTNITVKSEWDRSAFSGYAILRYTKTLT